jgi:hypothetical protein
VHIFDIGTATKFYCTYNTSSFYFLLCKYLFLSYDFIVLLPYGTIVLTIRIFAVVLMMTVGKLAVLSEANEGRRDENCCRLYYNNMWEYSVVYACGRCIRTCALEVAAEFQLLRAGGDRSYFEVT